MAERIRPHSYWTDLRGSAQTHELRAERDRTAADLTDDELALDYLRLADKMQSMSADEASRNWALLQRREEDAAQIPN